MKGVAVKQEEGLLLDRLKNNSQNIFITYLN